MEEFKKLLEIQKEEAKNILNNNFYDDEYKKELIENLFIGDYDLTDKEEFEFDENVDLMKELRAEAMHESLNYI